jgi:hypothetical protein
MYLALAERRQVASSITSWFRFGSLSGSGGGHWLGRRRDRCRPECGWNLVAGSPVT